MVRFYFAPKGLALSSSRTQGVALGWHVQGLRPNRPNYRTRIKRSRKEHEISRPRDGAGMPVAARYGCETGFAERRIVAIDQSPFEF